MAREAATALWLLLLYRHHHQGLIGEVQVIAGYFNISPSPISPLYEYILFSSCSYADALEDMDQAMETLRNNQRIDYKQLGLQYKLYSCEVRERGSGEGGGKTLICPLVSISECPLASVGVCMYPLAKLIITV